MLDEEGIREIKECQRMITDTKDFDYGVGPPPLEVGGGVDIVTPFGGVTVAVTLIDRPDYYHGSGGSSAARFFFDWRESYHRTDTPTEMWERDPVFCAPMVVVISANGEFAFSHAPLFGRPFYGTDGNWEVNYCCWFQSRLKSWLSKKLENFCQPMFRCPWTEDEEGEYLLFVKDITKIGWYDWRRHIGSYEGAKTKLSEIRANLRALERGNVNILACIQSANVRYTVPPFGRNYVNVL